MHAEIQFLYALRSYRSLYVKDLLLGIYGFDSFFSLDLRCHHGEPHTKEIDNIVGVFLLFFFKYIRALDHKRFICFILVFRKKILIFSNFVLFC